MEENNTNRGSLRVEQDIVELIADEQARLRKQRGGKKPTYSEILRRMWDAYTAPHHAESQTPLSGTAYGVPKRTKNEKWHGLLDEILEGGTPTAKTALMSMLAALAPSEEISESAGDSPAKDQAVGTKGVSEAGESTPGAGHAPGKRKVRHG